MLLFIILDKIYSVVNVVFSDQHYIYLRKRLGTLTISTFKEETIIDIDAITNLRLQLRFLMQSKLIYNVDLILNFKCDWSKI
jgi:hypothetical protein